MQLELLRQFEAIESQRANIENHVRPLSDTQLNWTPDAQTWSVRQIVEHLVLSDETIGRAQAVKNEALMFRVLPRAWRRALVLRAMNRDVALPLPTPTLEPNGGAPLFELLARWETARSAARLALETARSDETRHSHPVLGPLTVAQMLTLGHTHTAYHTRQMQALQRRAAFPHTADVPANRSAAS